MVKPLTIYKASAGSGKTFALAVQYIQLVVRNPLSYRTILAVTFTNKATEEMKTRILSQLYGIWRRLPDSQVYADAVYEKLKDDGFTPDVISSRAGQALNLLLHNYNHFRVMTIDTFFQSVLRNLARELDLTANLRIELNDTQVEELAVDQMIDDLQTTDAVLQWILKYIMENIDDDRSWNVISQIKKFGKTIFSDIYKEVSKEVDQRFNEKGFFDNYTRTLRELRDGARQRMLTIAESFFDTLESEGLSPDDLANKKRGIASFFYKLKDGIFDESIVNATVANCLEDPAKWYAKSSPRREQIHVLADGVLGQILRQAVDERPRQYRLYQSAKLTLRHLNQVRLLSNIEQKVHELNTDANRFLLSDTQKLLNALISESDSPFIFEKIGTQLEHIMIDEFQDTSTIQWKNFKVLLLETMSHKGSENLIVGDVKQSIYRWRSGDWQLLNNIEQQFPPQMLQSEVLKTNRRSDSRIIRFNNAFFAEAARLEYEKLQDQPQAEQLTRAYEDVEQLIPEGQPDVGYVNMTLYGADDYQEQTLSRLVDIVSDLRTHQVPTSRIAILVRVNNYIPLIANYFAQHCPEVRIISDEAFRLDASLPVNIIIHALRVLAHPDDQLAQAFLKKTVGTSIGDEQRADYLTMPLYELAERLFADFRLVAFDAESAYVCAFFDQLNNFTIDTAATIDDFLKRWDESIAAKTIQTDVTDGIRIVSIHKSKGLEFDNVLCPFCDWTLEKSGNVLWCYPTESPFDLLPIAPIDYNQRGMLGTIYEDDYHHEHLQNVVDNLNLLYVAFTRARQNLFIIGRRGLKNSRSAIIEQTLPNLQLDGVLTGAEADDQPLVYEYGSPHYASAKKKEAETDNVFLQPLQPFDVPLTNYRSKAIFRQSNQSQEFVSGNDEESPATSYIQLGSILHRVFSTIRTSADIDSALQQLESEGVLYDDQLTLDRVTTMLRKRLEHPRVADWFSDRWTLFNECTILSVEDGNVVEHRPDRVMTDGHQWIVVDFKFGHPNPEYHDQVRTYMELLRSMGHQQVSGYLWYVYSNKIESV